MEDIPTIREKNGGKSYEEIRNLPDEQKNRLNIDEFDKFLLYMRNLFLERVPQLADALETANQRLNDLPPVTKESLGLEAVPANLPFVQWPEVQNAVKADLENRAMVVDTRYQPIENVSGVFTPVYDAQKCFFSMTLSAAGTLQLKELHNETHAFIEVLVKRTAGSETLTFKDDATTLNLSAGTASTAAGSYTKYQIEKIDTLFFITAFPQGVPSVQANVVQTLVKPTGMILEQLPTVNGVIKVNIKYDQHPEPGVEYKLVRSRLATGGDATLKQNTSWSSAGVTDDGVIGNSTPLQAGTLYYYRVRVSKTGFSTSQWLENAIRVN